MAKPAGPAAVPDHRIVWYYTAAGKVVRAEKGKIPPDALMACPEGGRWSPMEGTPVTDRHLGIRWGTLAEILPDHVLDRLEDRR